MPLLPAVNGIRLYDKEITLLFNMFMILCISLISVFYSPFSLRSADGAFSSLINHHQSKITNQSLWLLICVNLCQSVVYKNYAPSVNCIILYPHGRPRRINNRNSRVSESKASSSLECSAERSRESTKLTFCCVKHSQFYCVK